MFCFISFTFTNCQNKIEKFDNEKKIYIVSNVNIDTESKYQNSKILNTVFVCNPVGVDIFLKPETNSYCVGKHLYGDKLDVIEINPEWLGILEEVTSESSENGKIVQHTYMDKVFIKRNSTCDLSEIKILQNELFEIYKDESENIDEFENPKNHLNIELTNVIEYQSKIAKKVDYLNHDTSLIVKKNGITELIISNDKKKYIDKSIGKEDDHIYTYLGQIDFLNSYLLYCEKYESINYIIIDKQSGNENSFIEYPYISQDHKYIICIRSDYVEFMTNVDLYEIIDYQFKLILSTNFTKWVPSLEENKMFWGDDGYFYIPVIHVQKMKYENEEKSDDLQYIKIKKL